MRTKFQFAASIFILLFALTSLQAYPKFAALTGEKCQSCHVNPTGGGMRNLYGVKYGKDNLYFKFWEKQIKPLKLTLR